MKDTIKPIETIYNGYKFRSRLEARWAVFFDAAGIRYEYEPEGFKTKNGLCYLPDFYLPDENIYVEVKAPREGTWKDFSKIFKFVGDKIPCILILSNIPSDEYMMWAFPVVYYHPVDQKYMIRHLPFVYDQCEKGRVFLDRSAPELGKSLECDTQSDEFDDGLENWNNELAEKIMSPLPDNEGYMTHYYYSGKFKKDVLIVKGALAKARKSRFEHGVKG